MFPFDPAMCITMLSCIPWAGWVRSIDPTACHNLCIRGTACSLICLAQRSEAEDNLPAACTPRASGLVPAQPVILGLSVGHRELEEVPGQI